MLDRLKPPQLETGPQTLTIGNIHEGKGAEGLMAVVFSGRNGIYSVPLHFADLFREARERRCPITFTASRDCTIVTAKNASSPATAPTVAGEFSNNSARTTARARRGHGHTNKTPEPAQRL
jgi:hypothetical protein